MKVLVIAGSKHGATLEMAGAIAAELRTRGHEASTREAGDVDDLGRYGAFVIGSAVYIGHWTKETRRFVKESADEIRGRPVWLFSSGPLGDRLGALDEPNDIDETMALLGAREHRLFHGALTHDGLDLLERATVKAVRAPYGDFRDWAELTQWAGSIADQLVAG